MTKLKRLQNEALESCGFRGHSMRRFRRVISTQRDGKLTWAYSHCFICNKQVTVRTHPAPNEIDIGGEAMALCCW